MNQKPILVVMAAGMGSRYGGLKQIDPVGGNGEAILDYSLFDAHEAGFETAVIIIKKAIEKDFMETVGQRLKACPMEIRYAYQELEKGLPRGFEIPAGRTNKQEVGVALALCQHYLNGRGAFRVHGGGFAGTIQAYIKEGDVVEYRSLMDSVFREGACLVLRVRPDGAIKVN